MSWGEINGKKGPICDVCGQFEFDAYMIETKTWRSAGFGPRNHCHIACLEKRLERFLTAEEFPLLPCNAQVRFGMELARRAARVQARRGG